MALHPSGSCQADRDAGAPTSLRRDAQRNRERILEVAGEVFATQGLNASMNDIAVAAGVGVGTVYRRFPDRADLIRGVFEQRLAGLERLSLLARNNPDPFEGIAWLFEQTIALEASDRGLTQLFGDEALRASLVGRGDNLRAVLCNLIAQAQASGQLRPDVAIGDFVVLRRMLVEAASATRSVSPDYWRRMLALCLDGLRARDGHPLPGPGLTIAEIECMIHAGRPRTLAPATPRGGDVDNRPGEPAG